MEKNRYKIYKKSPVSMAVALLLIISVDRCYPLRTRCPRGCILRQLGSPERPLQIAMIEIKHKRSL